jgi:hypothetical protein
MAGIFRIARKRCIREEDYKSNNRVIDKVVIQMSLLVFYYWYIKRGTIVTGYVGRLFSKLSYHVSLLLRELYILKICQIFNSFDSILSVEVCSSIPSLEMYCLLDNPPHKTKKVDSCGTSVENDVIFRRFTA